MRSEQSTALIVPYADALLPAGDPSFMAQQDRQLYLVFHRIDPANKAERVRAKRSALSARHDS